MHKKKTILLSLIYTSALVYYCLKHDPIPLKLPSQSDKILHALAYFIFTLTWFFTFVFTFKISTIKSLISSFIFAILFGIFIEFLQDVLTEFRQADVLDILANVFGTLLAIILLKLIYKDR